MTDMWQAAVLHRDHAGTAIAWAGSLSTALHALALGWSRGATGAATRSL